MDLSLDRIPLIEALSRTDLHELCAQADAERQRRHRMTTSFTLLRTLDLSGEARFSPLSGIELGEAHRVSADFTPAAKWGDALLERAHPAAGDYHFVLPQGIPLEDLLLGAQSCGKALEDLTADAPEGATIPTFQLGTADDWISAGADAATLREASKAGLRVISDGVRPCLHPGCHPDHAKRWADFWRHAHGSGISGNASLLFGPKHDHDAVVDQMDAIAWIQHGCHVFQSVSPVVFDPEGFHGSADSLLTQGQTDLRVIAAARIGLSCVDHVRMLYERSDLKMAHLSLASGVDDLEGHLHDGERSPKEMANSFDLNLDEMGRWLEEAGYSPALRNGAFEHQPEELSEA